ncbi:MAG: hypothetical protein R2724_00350 [Bryobacterales bacterium]
MKLQSKRNVSIFAVNLQERFLVGVPRILRRAQKVHRHAQNSSVVQTHELLERVRVALLRGANQRRLAKRPRFRGPPN